jgi:hypothetical protein
MIYQDEHSRHQVTIIPLEVQTVFWDKVVLPALKTLTMLASKPHLDFTVDELLKC